MNEKLFLLETQKKKTNHILHLILSILTWGLWLIVWGVVMHSNNTHNKRLSREMGQIVHYKSQGLSDVETNRKLKLDELDADARNKMILFFVIVGIFSLLYFNS